MPTILAGPAAPSPHPRPAPPPPPQLTKEVTLKEKKVDDVLGGEEAWKNVQKTQATCPGCDHHEAYFREIQTRSADEPATIFYRCAKCEKTWKEG